MIDKDNLQKNIFRFDAKYLQDPLSAVKPLMELGYVIDWSRPGDNEAWKLVLGYQEILELLSNPESFAKPQKNLYSEEQLALKPQLTPLIPFRRLINHFLPLVEGDYHTLLRKISIDAVSQSVIKPLSLFMDTILDQSIDKALESGELDGTEFGVDLSFRVIAKLLDIPEQHFDYLHSFSHFILTPSELEIQSVDGMKKTGEAAAKIIDYMESLIAFKRIHPDEDFISRLLAVESVEHRLTAIELSAIFILLLIAGFETTSNSIGNMLIALSQNPSQFELLKVNPSLIDGAVQESLRHGAAAPILTRTAMRDAQIGEFKIKEGEALAALLFGGNFDPRVFESPYVFDITRPKKRVLTFGNSIHSCIGEPLALMQIKKTLAKISERIKILSLKVSKTELTPLNTLQQHGYISVPLNVE